MTEQIDDCKVLRVMIMTPPVYPCLIVFLENIEGEVAPLAGATAPGKCFQFMLRGRPFDGEGV